MAVSTEVYRSEHPWTGVETSFNAGWPAALPGYVKGVFRAPSGAETVLVQGVNYTVSIAAGSKLVTCTPITMPGAAGTVVFYRETPATVEIVLQDNLNTPALVYQDLHDRAAMRDGEIRGELDRALVLPPGASDTGAYEMAGRQFQNIGQPTLPTHAARLQDIQDVVTSVGNVPSPTLGQIGAILAATGVDVFAWKVLSSTVQALLNANTPSEIVALLRSTPIGAIQAFPFQNAPAGWVKANGALLSRTTYADLFAAAQADGLVSEETWAAGNDGRFSVGDGSTTFRIPDYRGKFLRPWDDGRGIDAARAFGSSQGDAIRNITGVAGPIYGPSPLYSGNNTNPVAGAFTFPQHGNQPADFGTIGASPGANFNANFDASRVVPTAAENRPVNTSVLICLYAGV